MIDALRTGGIKPPPPKGAAAGGEEARTAHPSASPAAPLPRLVALAQELSRQEPPVDYVRIAQLRAAIADGSYKVDANAIARAMQQTGGLHE